MVDGSDVLALHMARLWAALVVSAPEPPDSASLQLPLFTVEPQDETLAVRTSWLPGLVHAKLSLTLDAPALQGAYGPVEGRVTLRWSGTIRHVFDGEIESPALALALLTPDDLSLAWHRVTAPPLTLTDEDLATLLPLPLASLIPPTPLADRVEPGDSLPLSGYEDLGILPLDPADLPMAVAMVVDYELLAPTARDVLRILADGGAADFSALGRWLTSSSAPRDLFPPTARRELFDAALALVQRLRGPPALGDLQRLRTSLLLLGWAASPEDLERLLPMERRIRLLATSGALSYEEALRGEGRLGVPFQEMHTLPSASEYLTTFDQAMQDLRREALAELLRLSFDPLDFRDADDTLHESPLREQARVLLAPLDPVEVGPMLDAAGERDDMRRDMIEFYAHAGHAPAARPVVRWLFEHPKKIPTLGRLVVRRLAPHVALPLFQAFANPERPEDREHARTMLLELPPEGRAVLARALAGVGIATTEQATTEQLLRTFELAERTRSEQQARALIEKSLHGADNVVAIPGRVRAVQRLARHAPDRLQAHAEELIEFLAHAALTLRSDAPAESDEALLTLERLPVTGEARALAQRTAALTRAEIAAIHGDLDEALEILARHDPHLAHPDIRERYQRVVEKAVLLDMDAGRFDAATARLHDLRTRSGDEQALSGLDERIFFARYWPAMALGGLFMISLLGTGGFLAWRSFRSTWRQVLATRKLRRKLQRRMRQASKSVLLDDEDEEMEALLRELDELVPDDPPEDDISEALVEPRPSSSSQPTEDALGHDGIPPGDALPTAPGTSSSFVGLDDLGDLDGDGDPGLFDDLGGFEDDLPPGLDPPGSAPE